MKRFEETKLQISQLDCASLSAKLSSLSYQRNKSLLLLDMDTDSLNVYEMDETTKMKWYKIVFAIKKDFGKKPDMNGLLFLIGMRELGISKELSKDEKMDIMHVATCALLALDGYYELESYDAEGWPHYKQLKQLPYADMLKQETFLKRLVVKYYDAHQLFEDSTPAV